MNILSDFKIRLDRLVPEDELKQKISILQKQLLEKDEKIRSLETAIKNSATKRKQKPKKNKPKAKQSANKQK
jgi:alpha-amylase